MLYPAPIANTDCAIPSCQELGSKQRPVCFYTIGMSDDDVNEFA